MRKFNISIPEEKVLFFLELMQNLGFVEFENKQDIQLSPEQKKVLDQRLKEIDENPDRLLDWEEVVKELEAEI